MAKKTKRQMRAETGKASSNVDIAPTSDFNPDYSYVLKDLRRIGLLAGSFIVILIAISVFLR